jgi:AcrR family transcriptional regulator
MASNEWRAVTVDKLCAAAGLNKRYFYESFTDLDAVAAAVVDDIADDVRTATIDVAVRTAAQPLEMRAYAAVDSVVRTLVADPRRARVLLGGVATSLALHDHRGAVMRKLTAVLVAHARTVHGVELEADPLARVAPAFVIGGTADAILAYVDGRARITLDELVQSLTTLWLVTGNGAAEVARARYLAN